MESIPGPIGITTGSNLAPSLFDPSLKLSNSELRPRQCGHPEVSTKTQTPFSSEREIPKRELTLSEERTSPTVGRAAMPEAGENARATEIDRRVTVATQQSVVPIFLIFICLLPE
jgi:hypothetical protein